ncbi:MAG: hypothetical protein EBS91_00225 [Betaproteobacteria bacterium]|nr:hypothetical protein [Betaproteobacteria bacterium]NCA23061.1 hypothetical protein [Betaproteobacteria bacterium]
MTTINIKQLASDALEDLAADFPDFGSEHVEEVISNIVAAEGLNARQQRELSEAFADLGF